MSAKAPCRAFGPTAFPDPAGALPRVACIVEMVMSGYVESRATMPPESVHKISSAHHCYYIPASGINYTSAPSRASTSFEDRDRTRFCILACDLYA